MEPKEKQEGIENDGTSIICSSKHGVPLVNLFDQDGGRRTVGQLQQSGTEGNRASGSLDKI